MKLKHTSIILTLLIPLITNCNANINNKNTPHNIPKVIDLPNLLLLKEKLYLPVSYFIQDTFKSITYYNDNELILITTDGTYIKYNTINNKFIINNEVINLNQDLIIKNNTCLFSLSDKDKIIMALNNKNDYDPLIIKELLTHQANSYFNPDLFLRYLNYIKEYNTNIENAIIMVNIGLDKPFYNNIEIIREPESLLVLCNKYKQLPAEYQPFNLVDIHPNSHILDGKEYKVTDFVYEAFKTMATTAEQENLTLKVISAYRTSNYQARLYNNSLAKNGVQHAEQYSARPRHSEHETGLAIDINSVQTKFENTKEFAWLKENAHKYGFILRYPKEKEHITGFAYEPWHYRYVGNEVATLIYNKNITFEEYHALYLNKNNFKVKDNISKEQQHQKIKTYPD